MNIVVVDNIKDVAMKLHKQVEQQILEPETTKEERVRLVEAQQSLSVAIRFLLQAIAAKVNRKMSRREK